MIVTASIVWAMTERIFIPITTITTITTFALSLLIVILLVLLQKETKE